MRCPRCQFENMPDQTACFRCGSVLDGKAVAVDVHPPRAPGWKKPFRRVGRWTRRRWPARKVEQFTKRASTRAASLAGDATQALGFGRPRPLPPWVELRGALWKTLVALALSIVPGCAQLAQHRFRAVYLYVLSWFVSLALGIFFFGSSFGIAAISSVIVLHAWIAVDAVPVFEKPSEQTTVEARFLWRLMAVAVLAILVYGMYQEVRNVAAPFDVGQSGIAVKAQDVELRDSILCRRLRQEATLKRGDLVLVRVRRLEMGAQHGHILGEYSGETVGQLIGLPGDAVRVTQVGFIVNDQALDPEKFPVPRWLGGRELTDRLGKQTYFVTMEYQVTGHGAALAQGDVLRACEFADHQVLARGVIRWFPLRKRGFLEELE